jgi:hypothetical protein
MAATLAPAAQAIAPAPAEATDGSGGGSAADGESIGTHKAPTTAKADPPPPNPRALTRAFERRHKHVEACFDRHAAGLEGQPQLSLHFNVGERGDVAAVEVEPASLADTALGRCLLEVARGTHFEPQRHALSFHIPITAQALEHQR